jgi:hypothetical protein
MTTKLELLKETFARNLAAVRNEKPDYFVWPVEELPKVTERMLNAIDRNKGVGGINIHSLTFARTAKEFGIKNSYKAWSAWLAS